MQAPTPLGSIQLLPLAPIVLAAALSGLFGTGLINLFNSERKNKWAAWAGQWVLVVIGLWMLNSQAEEREQSAVRSALAGLPHPATLRNLLIQGILEDLHLCLETGKNAYFEDQQNDKGASASPSRIEIVHEQLVAFINDAEKDAHRFQRTYLRDPDGSKLDDVFRLCDESRRRVADRLSYLISSGTRLSTSDFAELIREVSSLSEQFEVEQSE